MTLNADLGESWKHQRIGNDAALMPLLDRCNIACGFHGGDALTMQRTIDLALKYRVGIGAHPSFPDRKNFGRQRMDLPLDELEALLLYQVSALSGMVRTRGEQLRHIKPHGALYHYLDETPEAADVLARVAKNLGIDTIFGPPNGYLQGAAAGAGLDFMSEGFADRRYELVAAERPLLRDDASDWNTALDSIPHMAAEEAERAANKTNELRPLTAPDVSLRFRTAAGSSEAKGDGGEVKLRLTPRNLPNATIDSPVEAAAQVRRLITHREVMATDGKAYPLEVQTICIHGDHPGAIIRAAAVRAVLREYR